MVIPDAAFSAVRFRSYTVYVVRSTIGLLCDSYASYSLCDILIIFEIILCEYFQSPGGNIESVGLSSLSSLLGDNRSTTTDIQKQSTPLTVEVTPSDTCGKYFSSFVSFPG